MHLKIKTGDENIKSFYENHSHFHEGDSGLDLFVTEKTIVPGKVMGFIIHLGIYCEAFEDITKQGDNISYTLYPRSSMGSKTPLRLSNSVGIIDAGYRGELCAIVDNHADEEFIIEQNTRLFQLCGPKLEPITFQLVSELSETSRGTGGMGSTGA